MKDLSSMDEIIWPPAPIKAGTPKEPLAPPASRAEEPAASQAEIAALQKRNFELSGRLAATEAMCAALMDDLAQAGNDRHLPAMTRWLAEKCAELHARIYDTGGLPPEKWLKRAREAAFARDSFTRNKRREDV